MMSSQSVSGAEQRSLTEGVSRVKFQCKWMGTLSELYQSHTGLMDHLQSLQEEMADCLLELEQTGAAPVMHDGKVGGNAAVQFRAGNEEYLLVSKSGKEAHHRMSDMDFCVVTKFDFDNWCCEYFASDKTVLPTSDTPLHVCALNLNGSLDSEHNPRASLHGHALETEEDAKRCSVPISDVETLFSTPEDSAALVELIKKFPYPENKVFIRKNHGFVLLGDSIEDVNKTFNEKLRCYITKSMHNVF